MQINTTISITDHVSTLLNGVSKGVVNRAEIHEAIGIPAADLTRAYLRRLGATRHATAQRLGASPSGHWARAADAVRSEANANRAAIILAEAPGIGRAFRDVTIRPTGGRKYLTIPLIGQAYNRTTAQFRQQVGELFPLNTGKGRRRTKILATKQPGSKVAQAVYLLTPEVHQKQDRTLLPSDEHYTQAARIGITRWYNATANA